jgi:inner membrane protein
MDNLTHSLIGLTAAKAGLEKLSPGATALCLLAANAPDVDVAVLFFRGRWAYLHHHRGITHSILGACVLAIALPLVFYLGDLLISRLRKRDSQVRFKGLLLASVLVTATHPILDWTNNYGMRFLLPWNDKWFYGDFLFVIDPFFWIVLGGSTFLLTANTRRQVTVWLVIGGLATVVVMVGSGQNMSAGANVFRIFWLLALILIAGLYRARIGQRVGARAAIAGFAIVITYSAVLALTHSIALRQANLQAGDIAAGHAEQVLRVAAMPTLANPVDWLCILETDRATYKFQVSLFSNVGSDSSFARFEKPVGATAEIIATAERDSRAQIFLGFARFPGFRVVGEDCLTETLVQFADLRYTEPGKGRGTFSLDVPIECPAPDRSNK